MTIEEAGRIGIPDEPETVETVAALEPPPPPEIDSRHLALGTESTTLCGIPRKMGIPAPRHPSKARRTDCLACREAYRKAGKNIAVGGAHVHKAGERVEFPDGSAWVVEETRAGAMDVRCLIGSEANPKGRFLTISPDSPLRTFADAEFDALVEAAKPKTKVVEGFIARVAKEPKPAKPAGPPKWKPTKADVDEVRRLKEAGHTLSGIETMMQWPDSHGNRPWRILKGAWDYDSLEAGVKK